MNNHFIEVNDVYKTYNSSTTTINAANGLSFEIEEGEFVVIVGPSGAGKTTILNLLGGMDTVTSGNIFIDGKNISKLSKKDRILYRRFDIGFIFQFYNLMGNLTALENIELAVEICPKAFSPKETLLKVGLEDRADNFPAQLSGGEQQRVSIARAIAKNPKLLLCDEPTGALDYNTGKLILKLLYDLCKTEKKTVVIVTHNSALKDMADRVINIKNGKAESININLSPKNIEEIEW